MIKLLGSILVISVVMTGCYSTRQAPSRDYGYNDNADYNNNNNNTGYNNTVYNDSRQNSEVSYQVFYDQLQPYGNWINYPGYGYVWQPDAEPGFRPYETNGRWVSTVDGWAWASDYSWGWAPFHYGRWLNEPGLGWAWVPGYDWAPAWVTWGSYNNYYAWAPLAPGISISLGRNWNAPYNYWSCVPRNRIHQSNFNRYVTRPDRNVVVNNITVINNYNTYNQQEYYNRGPEYREVEQYTQQKITPVAITPSSRPGVARVNERQMNIYRPVVSNSKGNINSAPARVRNLEDIRNNLRITKRPPANNNVERPIVQPGVNEAPVGTNNSRNNKTGVSANAGIENTPNNSNGIERPGRRIFEQNRNNPSAKIPGAPENSNRQNGNDAIRQQEEILSKQREYMNQRAMRQQQPSQGSQSTLPERQNTPEQQILNSQRINNNRRVIESNRQSPNSPQPDRPRPVFRSRNEQTNNNNNVPNINSRVYQQQTLPGTQGAEMNSNRNIPAQRPSNVNSERPTNLRVRPGRIN